MKLQNLAIIFSIIIIPITLVLSLMMSNKLNAIKTEVYYNTALSTATRDGIKALEYNSYDNRFLSIADTVVRDAKSTINTFFNSLAMNLGLGDSGVDTLKPYVPAVAYIMHDGYYIYTPDITVSETGRELIENSLKPYIYYAREYYNGSVRIVVNYTLDNFINAYIYSGSANYKYLGGYIVDTNQFSGVHVENPDNFGVDETSKYTVKYNNIEITNIEAKKFYRKAYDFTKIMQGYTGLKYIDSNDEEHIFSVLFDSDKSGSTFDTERILTLRETIQSTLNAAIGNYNSIAEGNGLLYNFKMPVLKATDWEIALSNVSLITFFQGVNIGTKYYNGYSIASSYTNNYYTPRTELCFARNDEKVLHKIDCSHFNFTQAELDAGKIISGKYLTLANERTGDTGPAVYESCYYCFVDGNYVKIEPLPEYYQKIEAETYALEKIKEAKRYNLNY